MTDPGIPIDNPVRAPRVEPLLWRIIKEAAPAEYAQKLQDAMTRAQIEPNRALNFPLACSMEKHLISLPHKHEHAPEYSRDERLTAWFQTCVDMGAQPRSALAQLGEHASGGFSRLLAMKAYGAIGWWQAHGAEMHFTGPRALNGEPTTFSTLAFVHGFEAALPVLLPTSPLTHIDRLWGLVWSNRCLASAEALMKHLWPLGAPPKDVLAGLACAQVNKKNIQQVLAAARRFVEAGADPNCTPEGTPPALARALLRLSSPAGLQLVDFLLQHGANPLEKATLPGVGPEEATVHTSVIEVALDWWLRCSTHSHLRDTGRQCFERLARVADRDGLQTVFTPERQQQILQTLEAKRREDHPMSFRNMSWDPSAEVAALQALFLDLAIAPLATNTRRGPRL